MIPRELIYKQWVINYIEYLERKCDIKQWNWAWYMKIILSDVKKAVSSMKTHEDRVKQLIEKLIKETNEEDVDTLDDMEMWTHTWKSIAYKRLLNELYPNN